VQEPSLPSSQYFATKGGETIGRTEISFLDDHHRGPNAAFVDHQTLVWSTLGQKRVAQQSSSSAGPILEMFLDETNFVLSPYTTAPNKG
jgi:hypothetical protein